MRMAVVDPKTGDVVNVIEAAPGFTLAGYEIIDGTGASPGDTWDGTDFIPQPPPAPTPEQLRVRTLRDKIRQRDITHDELVEFIELRGL